MKIIELQVGQTGDDLIGLIAKHVIDNMKDTVRMLPQVLERRGRLKRSQR